MVNRNRVQLTHFKLKYIVSVYTDCLLWLNLIFYGQSRFKRHLVFTTQNCLLLVFFLCRKHKVSFESTLSILRKVLSPLDPLYFYQKVFSNMLQPVWDAMLTDILNWHKRNYGKPPRFLMASLCRRSITRVNFYST